MDENRKTRIVALYWAQCLNLQNYNIINFNKGFL